MPLTPKRYSTSVPVPVQVLVRAEPADGSVSGSTCQTALHPAQSWFHVRGDADRAGLAVAGMAGEGHHAQLAQPCGVNG